MKLRDYQIEAQNAILNEFESVNSTLLVMATGLGKTVVFCSLAKKFVSQTQKPVLILAHRAELLTQAQGKADAFGLRPAIEKAEQRADINSNINCVIASVQTLSQPARLAEFPTDYFSLIITDEAHHSTSETYRRIADYFKGYKHLGVTATPNRHDEIGLKNIFESCAYQYSIKDGIKNEWLCEIKAEQVEVDGLRLEDVRIVAGDFSQPELDILLRQETVLQGMVLPTMEKAEKRPTIVFTPSVEHAHAIADCFNRVADKQVAVAVDGKMKADLRSRNLGLFESGAVQYMVNVGIAVEGYDHPPTACIALFRPTRSLGLLAQMIGRGTRIFENKPDCLCLDFIGMDRTVKTMNVFDVLDGTILNPQEKEKALEFAEEGDDSLTALEKAKKFVVELESVKAKMRCFSTSKDFDILGLFAIPSAKGLYGGDLATEKQKAFLEKLGIKVSAELQKGEASKLLDKLVKRMEKKMASFKQMRYLKRLGYESNFMEDLSFDEASHLIGELQK